MAPKMSKVMKSELAKPATSKQAAAVKSKLSAMAMKSKGKKLEHGPKKLEKPCGTASYHSLTYINTCIYICILVFCFWGDIVYIYCWYEV